MHRSRVSLTKASEYEQIGMDVEIDGSRATVPTWQLDIYEYGLKERWTATIFRRIFAENIERTVWEQVQRMKVLKVLANDGTD
jgi:hypothetical protein